MQIETRKASYSMPDLLARGLRGTLVALAVFAVVGTVSAVWTNPLFVRMTPVGAWEALAAGVMAVLAGATAALWVPQCRARGARSGGVVGFLGIACPTCNKLLMFLFGGPVLLAWFDPVRPYLALAGIVVMAFAAFRTGQAFRASRGRSPMAGSFETGTSRGLT
ncbi:hypothetical protein EYF88_15975 [Paracoccus sediminis]|uniref:Integral membrane protein n=1 Tax=Paracoccus sediminis TaxID=1214787 RepID=A0ABY1YES9_9RHOB|nr:hypothetical protein [Paracoccus sediminis]TBN46780.1 hypothetical protein EYF88_15975 [Paracoccus sediminis]